MNAKHLFVFCSFFLTFLYNLKADNSRTILSNLPGNVAAKDFALPAAPEERKPLVLVDPEDTKEQELPVVNKPTPAEKKSRLQKKKLIKNW
ncbi:MAG: hypothetical protein LVQ75_02640 [Candidatus Babeliales bacterium]|jgi:hypothetical protein